jgi:hypothetical protein
MFSINKESLSVVLSVLWLTASDYPFGIFKFFLQIVWEDKWSPYSNGCLMPLSTIFQEYYYVVSFIDVGTQRYQRKIIPFVSQWHTLQYKVV